MDGALRGPILRLITINNFLIVYLYMKKTRIIEGVVIRRANAGEADRIVTLLTPEGKLTVVAKGSKKATSRKIALYELFNRLRLYMAETAGLPIVRDVELIQTYDALRDDFDKVSFAYWSAELLDRLVVAEGVGGALYPYLLIYLERIVDNPDPIDARAFELTVLNELGWKPELSRCAHCGKQLKASELGWSNRAGGVVGEECLSHLVDVSKISETAVKALRLLSTDNFSVNRRINTTPGVEQEIAEVLHHYLESVSERAWQTPKLNSCVSCKK